MAMSVAASASGRLNPGFRSPTFTPSLPLGFLNLTQNHPCLCFSKFRSPVSVACSLPDSTASSPLHLDPSLALKKKAMDILPHLRGTSIFLVGMDNPIKTSLAKLLAQILRYYYFDSDSLVEEAAGGKSSMEAHKEIEELETEVLKQLSSMGRLVVCAGNGAVRTSTNLGLLRYGISVWIDVPLQMVSADEEVLGEFEESREGYATADATISLLKVATQLGCDDPTHVTTEDMALEVLKEIEKLTRVKKMMEEAATPF